MCMKRFEFVNGLGIKCGEIVENKNGWTVFSKNGSVYRTVKTFTFAKNLIQDLGYTLKN